MLISPSTDGREAVSVGTNEIVCGAEKVVSFLNPYGSMVKTVITAYS